MQVVLPVDPENPFAWVLEKVVDARVRRLGLKLIASGWIVDGLGPLPTNSLPGDEPTLLAAVSGLGDDWSTHCAGCDLLRVSSDLDTRELLLWMYDMTTCSTCRESAVRILVEKGKAPPVAARGMLGGLRLGNV